MLLDQLLALAGLGYLVFPLRTGTKHPNGLLVPNGRNDATADPDKITAWHKAAPMSNWGMATDNVLVIDIDGKDNPWPNDPELAASLAECGALSITGRGGRHHIFRRPESKQWRSTAGKLGDHVDTRSIGGYIVLPGSTVTNDGKACSYVWVDGMELSSPPDELPPPPPWLIQQLDALAYRPSSNGGGHRAGSDAKFPEGKRNDGMFRIACSLRRMGMQELEILAALMAANEARCEPPLDESEVESIAERAAKYEPDQLAADLVSGELDDIDISALIPAATTEHTDETEHPEEHQKDPGTIPEHLMKPGGYIGKFIKYVEMTAHKSQPVLALAAGITLQSLAIGRRICDPIGTRPNIYVLGIAPSGQGKEAARQCIKNILCKAESMPQMAEGVASHAGLITAIHKSPRMILLIDEMGRWLKTVATPAAAPHLYAIITNLMKLFTSSKSVFVGDSYADPEKNKVIEQPSCSLYGTTVPQSLFESLTEESISDGFLSRIFAMEGVDNAPRIERGDTLPKTGPILNDLTNGFKAWESLNRGDLPEDCFIPTTEPKGEKPPTMITATIDKAAKKILKELQAESDRMAVEDKAATGTLWTRCEEKARILTLIHACSRIGPPKNDAYAVKITAKDALWGTQLAVFLTKRLSWLCHLWVSNGTFDVKRRAVLRFIMSKKASGATKTTLIRRFSHVKVRELSEILEVLEGGNLVIKRKIKSGSKGRPVDLYLSADDA